MLENVYICTLGISNFTQLTLILYICTYEWTVVQKLVEISCETCWLDFLIVKKLEHLFNFILWKSWISKSGFWLWIIVWVCVGAYIIYRVRGKTILTEHSNFLWASLFKSYFFNNFIAMVNNMKVLQKKRLWKFRLIWK